MLRFYHAALPPRLYHAGYLTTSVVRPSWPLRKFFAPGRFLNVALLFRCGENPLFAPANALVRMQAFQEKFRSRHDDLRLIFRLHTDCAQLLRETLDMFQPIEQLAGSCCIAELELSAQFEPLRDLLHVAIFEVRVEGASYGEADEIAHDRIGSAKFPFVLEFEFAGN